MTYLQIDEDRLSSLVVVEIVHDRSVTEEAREYVKCNVPQRLIDSQSWRQGVVARGRLRVVAGAAGNGRARADAGSEARRRGCRLETTPGATAERRPMTMLDSL